MTDVDHQVLEIHFGGEMHAGCSCGWGDALWRCPPVVDVEAWRTIRAWMVEAANRHLVDAGARQRALTSLELSD